MFVWALRFWRNDWALLGGQNSSWIGVGCGIRLNDKIRRKTGQLSVTKWISVPPVCSKELQILIFDRQFHCMAVEPLKKMCSWEAILSDQKGIKLSGWKGSLNK